MADHHHKRHIVSGGKLITFYKDTHTILVGIRCRSVTPINDRDVKIAEFIKHLAIFFIIMKKQRIWQRPYRMPAVMFLYYTIGKVSPPH